jgi:ubiquinone/menaquinone biosynthesis C-methylase UbiE
LNDSKERLYDNIYGRKNIRYEASGGLIGFLYKKLLRFEVHRCQAVFNLLPSVAGRLLDLGCGEGDFIFMAKDKFEECYGVDVSSIGIERAKKISKDRSYGNNIRFYNGDVDEGLPFNTSFFDVVTCIAVLEHVFNPPNVLDEIYRVLKPGGMFIVQVPNIAWLPSRFQLLVGRLPMTGGVYLGADWEHLHNFTKSILCQLLTRKGFEIQSISCSGVFANYRKWWLSVLGGDMVIKSVKTTPHVLKECTA